MHWGFYEFYVKLYIFLRNYQSTDVKYTKRAKIEFFDNLFYLESISFVRRSEIYLLFIIK